MEAAHPLAEWFWKRVDRRGDDDCWPWTGTKDRHGYGRLSHFKPVRGAHRLSYELATGVEPVGLVVCHSCDNPSCVNPRHLRAATQRDNIHEAIAKGRHRSCWARKVAA